MSNSILNDIKKLLGIDTSYTHFDADLIIFINTALASLRMLGVGDEDDFVVENSANTWAQFLDTDDNFFGIKTFVYLKVKLAFDPPQSSALIDVMKEELRELTCTLNYMVDTEQ